MTFNSHTGGVSLSDAYSLCGPICSCSKRHSISVDQWDFELENASHCVGQGKGYFHSLAEISWAQEYVTLIGGFNLGKFGGAFSRP